MPIFSNIDQVEAWVINSVSGFGLDAPGPTSTVGHDMMVAVAEGIQARSLVQQRGATEVWPENSDDYAKYKEEHYASKWINVKTSQMLSMLSLLGEFRLLDDKRTLEWLYGTGDPPRSSITGFLDESDLEVTDREKAVIAHASGRSFFELDQQMDNEKAMPILKAALARYLKDRINA
jgi:hypothetical protein